MPNDTVTLVLNGEVYLEDLATAVKGWMRLMSAISREESPRSEIHWVVDALSTGSFFGTLRAEPNGTPVAFIDRSVRKYEEVGKGIRAGRLKQYSADIREAAREIVGVIGSRVKSVRFETDDTETEVYTSAIKESTEEVIPVGDEKTVAPTEIEPVPSLGSIRGKLHTISDRGGLRFMLYEINTDRAVTCYLSPGGHVNQETLRRDWGKLASVTGIVRRDPVTGDPTTIRRVQDIQVIEPMEKGAWRRARGIAPALTPISPEDAIRAVRDG